MVESQTQSPMDLFQSHLRPWPEYISVKHFATPASTSDLTARLCNNPLHYASNHATASLCLLAWTALTDWVFLMVLIVILMGFWAAQKIVQTAREGVVEWGDVKVDERVVWWVWAGCALALCLFTRALSQVFWVVGVACLLIAFHSIFHNVLIPY